MGCRIQLGTLWAGYAILFVQIKDWSCVGTIDTFRIGPFQEGCLDGAFSDVVIGDELEEILVVIVDGLISDDPV